MNERTAKWWQLISVLAPCVALGACSGGSATNAIPTTAPLDAESSPSTTTVLGRLTREMSEHAIPGASIAVVQDGQLAFQAGAGVKAVGGDDPLTSRTWFSVSALSKMVLAATVMKLVEQGKLDLEYQLAGAAGPGGYLAEWLRLHMEVDVRWSRDVGVSLRGAWSDELRGTSSSSPGFLLRTKIAF